MSQKQVADALGLSKSAICRRESGDSGWRWVEIEKLTFLLGITLAAFVAGFKNQGE
ncbi:MAG: helix-turn-helix transcriptional regulator [Chloroflexi bacterium]|nr:helix-turn-helix transcriptional regulator [Chloroflexota bacterium]